MHNIWTLSVTIGYRNGYLQMLTCTKSPKVPQRLIFPTLPTQSCSKARETVIQNGSLRTKVSHRSAVKNLCMKQKKKSGKKWWCGMLAKSATLGSPHSISSASSDHKQAPQTVTGVSSCLYQQKLWPLARVHSLPQTLTPWFIANKSLHHIHSEFFHSLVLLVVALVMKKLWKLTWII